jgi:hypothetical protein
MGLNEPKPKSVVCTKHTSTCLQKAKDDEPIFVLRAQDATAPETISRWLNLNPQLPPEKARAAIETIKAMHNWPHRKMPD